VKTPILACLLAVLAVPAAWAFHRQSPPVAAVTASGDTDIPRVRSLGNRIALVLDNAGRQIYRHTRDRIALEAVTTQGDNENPAISVSGSVVAWDSDCTVIGCADPGRQIFLLVGTTLSQVTHDPTGTSRNPAVNNRGNRLAFESQGNLAGTGNVGAQQVFLRGPDSTFSQLSSGAGRSGNPVMNRSGRILAFDSTSDATTGADTGVAQVWVSSIYTGTRPITDGLADSELPAVSGRGKLVAFQSHANLAAGGADMGVPQIFAYELFTGTYHQITSIPGGCTNPSVDDANGDWRVAFTCSGEGFVHYVRRNERYRLPVPGTDTSFVSAELGIHFAVVSTKADLLGSGTTPGHRIYLLNLFKLSVEPALSDAIRF
jgi:Tol biopolymer transport system component